VGYVFLSAVSNSSATAKLPDNPAAIATTYFVPSDKSDGTKYETLQLVLK